MAVKNYKLHDGSIVEGVEQKKELENSYADRKMVEHSSKQYKGNELPENLELTEEDLAEVEELLFNGEFDHIKPIEVHIFPNDDEAELFRCRMENPLKRKLAIEYVIRQKEKKRLEKTNYDFFNRYFD